MPKLALYPVHPERICWGCDMHCRADDLACGNGTERTPHPIELFGEDWLEWAREQGGYEELAVGTGGASTQESTAREVPR